MTREEDEANAVLIAQAPDMMRLLIELVDIMNIEPSMRPYDREISQASTIIKMALGRV